MGGRLQRLLGHRAGVSGGLVFRAVIAGGLLALLVGAAFAFLLVAIGNLRASGELARESREELRVADGLEKLLVDVETGQRGFVITGEERFLEPWDEARAAFPVQARRLRRLADDPEQARRARRIIEGAGAYISDYSVPLVNAARRNEPSVRTVEVTAQGKRRLDALRAEFNRFAATERALLTGRQDDADDDARRAVVAAVTGLAGSVLLILIVGGYLVRAIVLPVRRTSEAAGRLAGGDLTVRLPETAIGEVGALERAFNAMGSSLEASHDELSDLAEEQAALRRVATLVARSVSPTEIFETVSREVGRLCRADLARMERYEPDQTVTGVAAWSRSEDRQLAVGVRLALEGVSVAVRVQETGGPVRVDSYAGASGPIADEARALGIRSSVGCPIVVEGGLWGVIAASSRREGAFPADTESRIAQFTELVATAIANAESRRELVASRARVVAAADDARRRIERDLHDGAQQRLVHTVITLKLAQRALEGGDGPAAELLNEALEHAERASEELRQLAHGILPAILTRGGLRAGVEALVSRVPLPVSVDIPDRRLSPALEATAYFIVAEALTNVVKHAGAQTAAVKAVLNGDVLELEVRDDGAGGARVEGSSGLIGLQDRAAAVDGTLRVESPRGGGTTVSATLPVPGTG